jgi:hypothetical protein
MEIEWEDPPEQVVLRARGAGGKYLEWAIALREEPGRWAVLPSDTPRSEKTGSTTAALIRRGKMKAFAGGRYDAVAEGAKIWVRYVGPLEEPDPGEGEGEGEPTPAAAPAVRNGPDPVAVRKWAHTIGLEVPAKGRLPSELVERYLREVRG